MSDADLLQRIRAIEQELDRRRVEMPAWTPLASYTPTYSGATTEGVTTYAANGQIGRYVRFGPLVYVQGYVRWTAATGTGNARVSLPIVAAAGTNRDGVLTIWTYNVTIGTFTPQALIQQGAQVFNLWTPANNAVSTPIAVEAAGEIAFGGWYLVE